MGFLQRRQHGIAAGVLRVSVVPSWPANHETERLEESAHLAELPPLAGSKLALQQNDLRDRTRSQRITRVKSHESSRTVARLFWHTYGWRVEHPDLRRGPDRPVRRLPAGQYCVSHCAEVLEASPERTAMTHPPRLSCNVRSSCRV